MTTRSLQLFSILSVLLIAVASASTFNLRGRAHDIFGKVSVITKHGLVSGRIANGNLLVNNAIHEPSNTRCTACAPGYGVLQNCTTDRDTVCMKCDSKHVTPGENHFETCRPCSQCGDGIYELHACTSTVDTECNSCATLTPTINSDYVKKCLRKTTSKQRNVKTTARPRVAWHDLSSEDRTDELFDNSDDDEYPKEFVEDRFSSDEMHERDRDESGGRKISKFPTTTKNVRSFRTTTKLPFWVNVERKYASGIDKDIVPVDEVHERKRDEQVMAIVNGDQTDNVHNSSLHAPTATHHKIISTPWRIGGRRYEASTTKPYVDHSRVSKYETKPWHKQQDVESAVWHERNNKPDESMPRYPPKYHAYDLESLMHYHLSSMRLMLLCLSLMCLLMGTALVCCVCRCSARRRALHRPNGAYTTSTMRATPFTCHQQHYMPLTDDDVQAIRNSANAGPHDDPKWLVGNVHKDNRQTTYENGFENPLANYFEHDVKKV